MWGRVYFTPPSRNNSHHLLSCHRVHNPGHHQPGHRHKQDPEYFLYLLILPEHINNRIRVRLHRLLNQLRQEPKERQEHDGSPNEC
jgi:hypothetical protein